MRSAMALVLVSFLLVSTASLAVGQALTPATKLSPELHDIITPPLAAPLAIPTLGGWQRLPPIVIGDWVTIDATAAADPVALQAELIALGARNTAIAGYTVSAKLPIAAISSLEGVASLQSARMARPMTNVGLVTSQGDVVMRANTARTNFGVDGTGVRVGVLSDSYNCLGGAASDIASNDLPSGGVNVIEDLSVSDCFSDGTDEGRAMLQIVHDVARCSGFQARQVALSRSCSSGMNPSPRSAGLRAARTTWMFICSGRRARALLASLSPLRSTILEVTPSRAWGPVAVASIPDPVSGSS
jgi:hypothetical protein